MHFFMQSRLRELRGWSRTLVRWARRGDVPVHSVGEGKLCVLRFFESEPMEWVT
jgi:hypothetical protein